MLDYDAYRASLPPGCPSRTNTRHNVTARITRFFDYQTYQLSTFVWISPNEEDYYVNPELRYTIADSPRCRRRDRQVVEERVESVYRSRIRINR